MANRSRCWTLTVYGPDSLNEWPDSDYYKKLIESGEIRFIAYGEEVCPTTQRKHHQAYCAFDSQKTFGQMKKLFPTAHIELMRGSLKQNADYCGKESTLVKIGEEPNQGVKRNLAQVCAQIQSGESSVTEVLLDDPFLYHQYGRTIRDLEDVVLRERKRTWMTEGIWYWGPTGTGKSQRAFESDPDAYVLEIDDNGWWDGYVGQETVIIDEFRGQIPYSKLLKLVDRYPHKVARRNREPAPFLAKRVIVTSCAPPEEIYNNLSERDSLAQLHRRFKVVHTTPIPPDFLPQSY